MRYRALDANGDYVSGTGADFLVNSSAAVAQAVKTSLALFAGEWFLDITAGMPWTTEVLGKYTSNYFDPVIKAQILDVSGVLAITSYASTWTAANRNLSVSVSIVTIYGDTSLDVTL